MHEVVVLARGAGAQAGTGTQVIVDWDGVCEGAPGVVSVRDLVEGAGDRLRARFAAWIYDLGAAAQPTRSNRWWLTTLAEKCNWDRSPWIHDALKLMAFDAWAAQAAVGHVQVIGAGQPLAECFQRWGSSKGVTVVCTPAAAGDTPAGSLRRLPEPVLAILWLVRHIVRRWRLRQLIDDRWATAGGTHMLFSFLVGLPSTPGSGPQQANRYWTSLPDHLDEPATTRWVHLFEPDPTLPDSAAAVEALSALSSLSSGRHLHVTLDSFLSVAVIAQTVYEWAGNSIRWALGTHALRAVRTEGMDIWPLCEAEWARTTRGPDAISAILSARLFAAALLAAPRQAIGLFPFENQGWAAAMMFAWRAARHGTLVGYCHSTVRYWDLRYVHDVRTFVDASHDQRPLPDFIAVHSPHERAVLEHAGYPAEQVIDVEALRYLYLHTLTTGEIEDSVMPAAPALRIIVFGEYAASTATSQIALLEQAMSHVTTSVQITVKPHPATPVRAADSPALRMATTTAPLQQLVGEFSVAYAGPMTTAAVEAWCAGLRVITMVPAGQLNLSPLRGFSDVVSVSTAAQLAAAICAPIGRRKGHQYFNLDPDLCRWRTLLHSIRRRESGQEG